MLNRHFPVFLGLFTATTLTSSIMLIYRLLGFQPGEALYLACPTFAGLAYLLSRRALSRFGRK
jgi:uncharacterized membrane protein